LYLDTDESIEEEENGVEVNIGNCATDEEEDGAVTVLKLSNGVMFRVPVEVQGMQLQAVVDTAAQVILVSEEFYKSLDPAPPIRKEVVMNTAGKGMQMNWYIALGRVILRRFQNFITFVSFCKVTCMVVSCIGSDYF
jgi:predicted aspartyl protease